MKETKSFKTETKRMLDLMTHSIYTNKDIFIRELISNASDAIDKLKFKALTDKDSSKYDKNFEIFIKVKDDTLTISDNGIGMTYDEVVENLGTIAKSGTKSFLEKVAKTDNKEIDLELIGQFGVGFYSSFMIADNVVVETKSIDSEKGIRWESTGDGSYTIEEIEKEKNGTDIILHLKEIDESDETAKDYTQEYVLKNLITTYSNFVRYPVKMEIEHTEYPKKEDGTPDYEAAPTKELKVETINAMKPLWLRNKKDIKEEEYNDFYKQTFNDWTDALDVIHTKAEGMLEYTALLYIPKKAPFDLYTTNFKKGIKLYSKNVFIKDKCEEIIPEHYKFVKGLVDSSDFSLNISREILQKTKSLKVIGKNIEKKIHSSLKYLLDSEREKYVEFWNEFGKTIKAGIYNSYDGKDKIADLLIFESTNTEPGKYTSLKEYIERMKEEQEKIYFVVGENREALAKVPQMEYFNEKGYEVLFFLDKVDEFIITNLTEFDGKKIQSISRGELEQSEEEKKETEEIKEASKDMLEAIKEVLANKVTDVRLTNRLKSSAVCLVTSDSGVSLNMEAVLKNYDAFTPKSEKILELNPTHKLYTAMQKVYEDGKDSDRFKNYSELLLDQALLMERINLEDPIEFANKVTDLMIKLTLV